MTETKEMVENRSEYRKAETSLDRPHRCGDGRRPEIDSKLGPQMLGGSTFGVVLHAIHDNIPLDEDLIAKDFAKLKQENIGLGVHRDDHGHGSGCGFADNLPKIFSVIKGNEVEIRDVLSKTYQANETALSGISGETITKAIDKAFNSVKAYNFENFKLSGDALISAAEKNDASTEVLTGEHKESVAYLNTEEGITFNTNEANNNGEQAFNVDHWAIVADSHAIGLTDDEYILGMSLITYVGTEIVLVEQKGKDRLSVEVNS